MEKQIYYADMSDGSSQKIGDIEDTKKFLILANKTEKGLIITKYGAINPSFIVSVGGRSINIIHPESLLDTGEFYLAMKQDNNKLLN